MTLVLGALVAPACSPTDVREPRPTGHWVHVDSGKTDLTTWSIDEVVASFKGVCMSITLDPSPTTGFTKIPDEQKYEGKGAACGFEPPYTRLRVPISLIDGSEDAGARFWFLVGKIAPGYGAVSGILADGGAVANQVDPAGGTRVFLLVYPATKPMMRLELKGPSGTRTCRMHTVNGFPDVRC